MWSFYHDKSHQIWLWWAIDHATNTPLAFTFGTREHKNLDDLLALLQPFPIRRVYTDNNFAYHKRIPAEQHTTGIRYKLLLTKSYHREKEHTENREGSPDFTNPYQKALPENHLLF